MLTIDGVEIPRAVEAEGSDAIAAFLAKSPDHQGVLAARAQVKAIALAAPATDVAEAADAAESEPAPRSRRRAQGQETTSGGEG